MQKLLFIFFLCVFCMPSFAYMTSDVVNGCDKSEDFVPVFIPNEYTCASGYFLPANTVVCRVCPSGYTCPGGTYAFNPGLAQGINMPNTITQNISYACSANFVKADTDNYADMVPIFTPNETITVNFNNGETVETITCVYDTEFTLPETPTRVGYVFAGWKVHNAE